MSTIAVQSVYDQKKREFAVAGSSADRFQLDFLDAIARAIRRINIQADLASPLTAPDDLSDTITVDNQNWEFVFSDLISDELVRMGQRPAKGQVLKTKEQLDEEIDLIRQNILSTRTDSDSDDDTFSDVGLGALES